MAGTFSFCPASLVAETLPPEPAQGVSMNGWAFTSKPRIPFQKKFKVTLHGLRWIAANPLVNSWVTATPYAVGDTFTYGGVVYQTIIAHTSGAAPPNANVAVSTASLPLDSKITPTINARALELFYQANGVWDNFTWVHPHLGSLTCRFATMVTVPAALPNSNGFLEPLEIVLLHHNPGF
jgi:hypothetical protein